MTHATADERYLLTLINKTRAANGQERLYLDLNLNGAADSHSAWMLQTDRFAHAGAGGSSATDRMRSAGFDLAGGWKTGENIAYVSIDNDGSLRDEIAQLHQNLMNSPSHRATLLSGKYDLVGLGLTVGSFVLNGRSYSVLMLTEDFAATGGRISYDLAPGISIQTATAPVWSVALPDRTGWLSLHDGGTYRPDAGQGSLTGGQLNDDFILGASADQANGAVGHDWMAGGSGNDRLLGGAGHDRMLGQSGNDTLAGEDGDDRFAGGDGADTLIGGTGNDDARGEDGLDLIVGQTGDDRLAGGDDNDILRGDAGLDRLDGGTGHDRLYGGTEADTLAGGAGNDLLSGEAGADSFVFSGSIGRDRVMDYQPRLDRILIDDALITRNLEAFVSSAVHRVSGGVQIDLAADQSILVSGNLTVQQVADGIFLI